MADIQKALYDIQGNRITPETVAEAVDYDNSESGLTATDMQGAIDEVESEKIDKTSIADNLTTDDATKVLSAKQGKVLKDAADTLTGRVTANEADIAELEPKVDDLETAVAQIDVPYISDDIVGVEVDLENKTFTRISGAVGLSAGANFDKFNAFGGRRRCNLADDGTVNAYYGDAGYIEDGSNGQVMVEQPKFYYKVVPLKLGAIADYAEVNTIKITASASSNGDVTVTLNGDEVHTVTVVSGDTAAVVAGKIRSATFTGWTVTGATDSAIFTCDETGVKTTASFSGGVTGVTATVTKNIAGGVSIGYHMRKGRYYVSDYPKAGFNVHPAFVRNNVEKEKVYLSAYEGSIYDVSTSAYLLADEQIADFTATTGDKIASIAGAKPMSGLTQNLTMANTRVLATNRGAGWQQKDVLCASASQMLMMIEYAAMNMQTAIGRGVVDKASGTGNESEITGATTLLGNASGMAAGTNGLVSVTYRGEENFWGNIWKWVDGLNIETAGGVHEAWYADNGFVDNIKTSPYKNAGFTLAKTNGYVSAIGWSETCDFLFLTTATAGDSSLPVGDYFYQNHASGLWYIVRLANSWYRGLYGGAFCWDEYNSSATSGVVLGGRAVYVPTT
jgi:hypothetical protein